jgi:hypothetical protein
MRYTTMLTINTFLGTITLLSGGLIYLLFRPDSLLMFSWLEFINLREPLESVRTFTLSYSKTLPDWLVFSAPNGLWMLSFSLYLLAIWKNVKRPEYLSWLILLSIIAVISEFLQLGKFISGHFDIVDIAAYVIGASSVYFAHSIRGLWHET